MALVDELRRDSPLFIDTAPIIYFIEAHPRYGTLTKEVVSLFQTEDVRAFSSVLTLTEVLVKPAEMGDEMRAKKFSEFLMQGKGLTLVEITAAIAERAGRLRGKYPALKTVDAVQVAAALNIGAGAFLTNDKRLKTVTEIKVFVLKDYAEKKETAVEG